jgi:hypothetical protein
LARPLASEERPEDWRLKKKATEKDSDADEPDLTAPFPAGTEGPPFATHSEPTHYGLKCAILSGKWIW